MESAGLRSMVSRTSAGLTMTTAITFSNRIFMKQTIYTLLALLAVATVNAQIILDDFNDGMTSNWAGPIDGSNSHTYTESGGEMRIDLSLIHI